MCLQDCCSVQAAGIKETYYGYDDDSRSVDSELSSSSRLSSSRQSLDATIDDDGDDNVFEEVCCHLVVQS